MFSKWHCVAAMGVALAFTCDSRLVARAADPLPEAGVPPAAAESPDPVKHLLAFKFQPGQILRYEVASESEITTHAKNETETVRNSSKARRHYRVTGVDEKSGDANLELSIDWVHMVAAFENPNRPKPPPVEFQSDDPQKHPRQFQEVLDTVGKPRAVIRFSPAGKPLEVVEGRPVKPPAYRNQLAQGSTAAPIHDTTPESYLLPLPENPVSIGETWKEQFDIVVRDSDKNLVRITIQRSYMLAEVKEGRALIEFRTTVLTPVKNPSIAGQLIQREIAGKAVFDMTRGLLVSREAAIDRTVHGPFGPGSSMHARSQYRETLSGDETIANEAGGDGTAAKK
jgi:hypothetical protein